MDFYNIKIQEIKKSLTVLNKTTKNPVTKIKLDETVKNIEIDQYFGVKSNVLRCCIIIKECQSSINSKLLENWSFNVKYHIYSR